MKNLSLFLSLFIAAAAWGDTPPPNTVKAKLFTGDGLTSITATGTSLNVDVTNPVSFTPAANASGAFVESTSISTSPTTFSPPANVVGFIIEASSANSVNLRWTVVTAPSTTSGMRLEPGRDSGYMPVGAAVKVVSESGSSQEVQIQWVLSQ